MTIRDSGDKCSALNSEKVNLEEWAMSVFTARMYHLGEKGRRWDWEEWLNSEEAATTAHKLSPRKRAKEPPIN